MCSYNRCRGNDIDGFCTLRNNNFICVFNSLCFIVFYDGNNTSSDVFYMPGNIDVCHLKLFLVVLMSALQCFEYFK